MDSVTKFGINSPKVINAWCSYDIANSAYILCVNTVLYPIYYDTVTKQAFGSEMISFAGATIKNTVLYDYTVAAGYLMVILFTLTLSGIADMGGYRKRFMQFFTLLGSLACIGLFGFHGANINLGIILPALAIVGFAGSLVYYNSFLPIIATPDRHDSISARGFSFGYAGSVILLIFNLLSLMKYEWFGFRNELHAMQYAFVEVGIWWLLISQFAFYYLRENSRKVELKREIFGKGFREVVQVFKMIRKQTSMYRFLLAFFFFSIGVQTIIVVATMFGKAELDIKDTKLIIVVLIIQLVAILGALIFARVSSRYGNKISLMIMLIIWVFVCISAYNVQSENQFFLLAALVGMVMGGIQSQARSTWSKLIPEGNTDTASFFSFYDSTEKLAVVIGMMGFGLIEHITGSMRNSALMLSVFFITSLVIISFTKLNTLNIRKVE